MIERPLFCSAALWSRKQQPDRSWQVVTLAVKFEMRTIHMITNISIRAKLKTGGAYYTQVRIISETLR